MRKHGPHQAAARSPRRPALDEDWLLVLLGLRESLLVMVLNERELGGSRGPKAKEHQESEDILHLTED